MAWRDDDDGPMISALAELSERCMELEQRVSMLEDEEWDEDDEGDHDADLDDDDEDEGDGAEADYLGDIADDEEEERVANAVTDARTCPVKELRGAE